jgi:hypothetical protein
MMIPSAPRRPTAPRLRLRLAAAALALLGGAGLAGAQATGWLYSGVLDTSDPTWRRPYLYAGSCFLSSIGSAVRYDVHERVLDSATSTADLSVSLCAGTSFDSVLFLYQRPDGSPGGFSTSAQCTNLVGYNDDYCGSSSRIDSPALVRGHVTAVITTFANGETGGYGAVALSNAAPLGDFIFYGGFEMGNARDWSAIQSQ